jgi:hypothetical protein
LIGCAKYVLPTVHDLRAPWDRRLFSESARSYSRLAGQDADAARRPRSAIRRHRITACEPGDRGRTHAEDFVREAFFRTHGARIHTFMPTLLVLADAPGPVQGVAGIRPADSGALYLERYLDEAIEDRIERSAGVRTSRAAIVELGNFACRDSSVAGLFMSLLPTYLLDRGLSWIAFTATAPVRRILQGLGGRTYDLGPADGACARDGVDDWGRYYNQQPRVMAGYLPLPWTGTAAGDTPSAR